MLRGAASQTRKHAPSSSSTVVEACDQALWSQPPAFEQHLLHPPTHTHVRAQNTETEEDARICQHQKVSQAALTCLVPAHTHTHTHTHTNTPACARTRTRVHACTRMHRAHTNLNHCPGFFDFVKGILLPERGIGLKRLQSAYREETDTRKEGGGGSEAESTRGGERRAGFIMHMHAPTRSRAHMRACDTCTHIHAYMHARARPRTQHPSRTRWLDSG